MVEKKPSSDDLFTDVEVELIKKAGKGLGLSVVGRRDGSGVFISDMVIIKVSKNKKFKLLKKFKR